MISTPPAANLATKFPSLGPFLSSSRVLALYFAASWCPDCTPITPMLSELYLEPQNTIDDSDKKDINVLYISSDNTSEQMKQYFAKQKVPFSAVPFENVQERTELKQHFGACAGKEAVSLGMTPGSATPRKSGIPTVVVLDCVKESLITAKGVQDLANPSVDPFNVWRL